MECKGRKMCGGKLMRTVTDYSLFLVAVDRVGDLELKLDFDWDLCWISAEFSLFKLFKSC
jgi:hypothetical protein